MKNTLFISASAEVEMLSCTDDGTNKFYINGSEIPVADWIGTGYYVYTVDGIDITFEKAPSGGGNFQLIQDDDYQFHFAKVLSKRDELINLIYPVGSIYMSTNSTSPGTLFGGTWEQIKDKFLLSAGDTYSAGATGGAATVTLTGAQSGVASHSHGTSTTDASFLITEGEALTRHTVASGSGAENMVRSPSAVLRNQNTANATAANASQAHENMPPYLAVYVWKRTA